MINRKVEEFLEQHNMDFMFLLLANAEVSRLTSLPDIVKRKILSQKITEMAMDHVADNKVEDYVGQEELFEEIDEDDELI